MRACRWSVSLALAVACAHAPPPSPPRARARDAPATDAFELVRSLTDEAGPRLAGSDGDRAAVAWGVRTLTALGFANVRAEPVAVARWERGEARAEVVAPVRQSLALAALGGSVATPDEGIEAEVVEAPSLEALAQMAPERVRGRIVFINQRTARTRDGSGYGAAVTVRYRGAARAARAGAVALVIRSIGTDADRHAHTGAMRYDDDAPRIPAAALAIPDAELLHRLVAGAAPVRLRLALGCRALPDATSANVVGEVPGADRAHEVVLAGAHLDAWDLGRGAVDDGAGCAIVIEAARRVARAGRPRRTLRVVLFANEENGLAGARAYAREHADELPRHVLAVEADAGDGRVFAARYRGSDAGRRHFADVVRALAPLGVTADPETAHGGADLSPLRPHGVPMIDLLQDMTGYFDVHHTANDTLDRVRPRELDHAVAAFETVLRAAATTDVDFGRAPAE